MYPWLPPTRRVVPRFLPCLCLRVCKNRKSQGAWERGGFEDCEELACASTQPTRGTPPSAAPPGPRAAQAWGRTAGLRSLHPTYQLRGPEHVASGSSLGKGAVITTHLPQEGSVKVGELVHRKPPGPSTVTGWARLVAVALLTAQAKHVGSQEPMTMSVKKGIRLTATRTPQPSPALLLLSTDPIGVSS